MNSDPERPLDPTVSVVIVNYNGLAHLQACLPSLLAVEYPEDRLELIVVDNASSDGSVDWLKREHPQVKIETLGANLGFASGVNVGANAASGDILVLLNNDMQVENSWLRELVNAIDPAVGIAAAGSLILDWNGDHVDFHDAAMTFYGLGLQPGHGLPANSRRADDGADLLFACGGAMAVLREVFLDVGGFDDDYFAYYEDVDFGWRLRVLGHRTVLATKSVCRHRHHGSSGSIPAFQRSKMLERNALRTIIKNYDDRSLRDVLGPAMMLLVSRAVTASRSSAADYRFALGANEATEAVQRLGIAPMHAVAEVLDEFPHLWAKRLAIQARRRTPEDEILGLLGEPMRAVTTSVDATEDDHLRLGTHIDELASAFELDRTLRRQPVRRVLILAYGAIGEKMSGPAIRCWEIACALTSRFDVVIASTERIEREFPRIETVRYRSERELRALAADADAIMLFGHELRRHPWLRDVDALRIVDLYDPWTLEQLEQLSHQPLIAGAESMVIDEVDTLNELVDIGDFFVCASERQRDFWLGMLMSRGRVSRAQYVADPTLRDLIEVVPYGCPPSPPEPGSFTSLDKSVPADAFVVLWSGGIWDWFDPITVVEAVAKVAEYEPRIRLCFLGLELNADGKPVMRNSTELWERIEALGIENNVILGPWVPYDERGRYLAAADVAIIATKQVAEVRYSFRSRVLDHYWAGLPTITTGGDVISDELLEAGAGFASTPGDASELAELLRGLMSEPSRLQEASAAARELATMRTWNQNVVPLERMLANAARWRDLRAFRPSRLGVSQETRRRVAVAKQARTRGFQLQSRLHGWLGRLKRGWLGSSPLFPLLRKLRRTRLGKLVFGEPTSI